MFKKATKAQRKLRAALFGPSGAGKTYTALQIAKGLGGSIAVIDTERGSASLYSDRVVFDVGDLTDRTIKGYVQAIKAAAAYDVLIIDSLTHAWQELLQEVEKLAQAKYRGNTWSAWSEGTPRQRQLVDAILDFPGHVLVTMRSKTEWTVEKNRQGKDAPVRVGLSPEQGKGIEYEFDVLFEINVDHIVNVIKDRSGMFQDRLISKPGPEFGEELRAWLADGEPPDEPLVAAAPAAREPDAYDEMEIDELAAAVSRKLKQQGLTIVGFPTAVREMTKGQSQSISHVPPATLRHLLRKGAKPESIERWNAEGEALRAQPEDEPIPDDDVPAAWALPVGSEVAA